MSKSADSPQVAKSEKQSFMGKSTSEVADFGEGIFYGAIESPVNGAVQMANHLTSAHLPEMHLVDENRLNSTVGGTLGRAVGTAADVVAATLATGGAADALGGASVAAAAIRFGAVGAAYTTLLQPTDDESSHFFQDRLTNGAVALGTYAAMGGAAAGLDALGAFAVPGARSLAGTLAYGAISGASGGLAHAEADAVLKNGKVFPSIPDVEKDVLTFGAFGMAYGGIGYGINQLTAKPPVNFNTDKSSATLTLDGQGNPIKADLNIPALNSDARVRVVTTKMTDGSWSTSATSNNGNATLQPSIANIKVDGNTLYVNGGDGINRTFVDGGAYKRVNVPAEAKKVAEQEYDAAEHAIFNKTVTEDGVTINRGLDRQFRIQSLSAKVDGAPDAKSDAWISYDDSGKVSSVSVSQNNQKLFLQKQTDNSWKVYKDDQIYKWNGDVRVVPAPPGGAEKIEFAPTNGVAATFDARTGVASVKNMVDSTSTYVPGGSGGSAISVDNDGNTTLTAGTRDKQFVNGKPIAPGQSVVIKPGDDVKLNIDVGDRYPVWETRDVKWGSTADGTPVFGTTPLKPGTRFDFKADDNSTVPFQSVYSKR